MLALQANKRVHYAYTMLCVTRQTKSSHSSDYNASLRPQVHVPIYNFKLYSHIAPVYLAVLVHVSHVVRNEILMEEKVEESIFHQLYYIDVDDGPENCRSKHLLLKEPNYQTSD